MLDVLTYLKDLSSKSHIVGMEEKNDKLKYIDSTNSATLFYVPKGSNERIASKRVFLLAPCKAIVFLDHLSILSH